MNDHQHNVLDPKGLMVIARLMSYLFMLNVRALTRMALDCRRELFPSHSGILPGSPQDSLQISHSCLQ